MFVISCLYSLFSLFVSSEEIGGSPDGAIVVFNKGEGGYYCHRIPYLFKTRTNNLIALGEYPSFSLTSSLSHSFLLYYLFYFS